jgi:internalin A
MKSHPTKQRSNGPHFGMRFSLRALLGTMMVAAVLFAWFGWRLRKSQRQARAVAVLQRVGAAYAYDFQGPISRERRTGKLITLGQSRYPRRMHQLLGVDFLHNVTRVHLESSVRLSDEDVDRLWSALGQLPDLIYLEASGPVTKPGAIQQLVHVNRLQRLALRWAGIANDDLIVLSRMPRLAELSLNETPVTDGAMVHAGRAKSLQDIELHHSKITDAGLRDLAKLPQLRRLRLSATEIGDTGMRYLRASKSLRDLNLEHTRITDEGLSDLAMLAGLEQLDLSLNTVSERGIQHLTNLASLKRLRLSSTPAGPSALAMLSTLPALEELQIDGSAVSGDLAPLYRFPKLRRLSCPLRGNEAVNRGLRLPPSLEELAGVTFGDSTLLDQVTSLPNLKVIHTNDYYGLSIASAEESAIQRLQAARPAVQVLRK